MTVCLFVRIDGYDSQYMNMKLTIYHKIDICKDSEWRQYEG